MSQFLICRGSVMFTGQHITRGLNVINPAWEAERSGLGMGAAWADTVPCCSAVPSSPSPKRSRVRRCFGTGGSAFRHLTLA